MPLTPGTQLGAYEIAGLIGAGGMGEVYRARDTRLGRDVALKTLPDSVTQDPERLARFRREAQVLAALNHQHIASIYGLEEVDRQRFLVLELVDGETLAARIQRGALPLEEAIGIAREIAEALESAHEKGIVHRDLKPANIALTSGDRVKVLDFGLAKAVDPSAGPDSLAALNSPTITSPAMLTGVGMILGTAAYMSPEQARGKNADKRSDVWAFGCVLYEMLTAKRAFEGSEVSDTLAAVLKSDPDWTALPPHASAGIRRVLRRCLEKDPRRRFHDVADVRLELEELPARETATISPAKSRWRERAAWAVAAVSLALLGTLAAYVVLKPAPAAEVSRFQVYPPRDAVFGGPGPSAGIGGVAVSPDGTRLVFVATGGAGKSQLWMRALDSFDALPLTGTEGAIMPFWSPDSRWIGFFAGNKLMKIQSAGGSPQWITDVESLRWCGTWGSGGDIVFSSGNPPRLFRVRDQGGVAVPLPAEAASADPRLPYFLPDGRTLLYLGRDPIEGLGVYVTSTAAGSTSKRLVSSDIGPAYDPSGFLLFAKGGALLRRRFDPGRLEISGETTPVAEGVGYSFVPVSVSTNGVLAFQPRLGLTSQFAWFDRTGRLLETVGAPGSYRTPHLSPDGNRLVYTNLADGNLWILDMRRRIASPFTTGPGIKLSPVWSPDGGTIFYGKQMQYGSNVAVFEKSASDALEEKPFFKGPTTDGPTQVSRDGTWLLYWASPEGEGVGDIYALPMTGDRTPQRIVHSPSSEVEPQLSPDGKFVAYVSNATGESEIYVQPFPSGERSRISNNGGRQPLWRPDGRELFFISPDRKFYAVEIKPGPTFDYGTPRLLFEMRANVYLVRNSYIPSPDGTRFLVNMALDTNPPPIHVIRNWTADVKK